MIKLGLKKQDECAEITCMMEAISEHIFNRNVPCVSKGILTTLMKSVLKLSYKEAYAEFRSVLRDLISPSSRKIAIDKKIGTMKIGHALYFYPLDMIRNYVLTRKLASFPGVILYLMGNDTLADDRTHSYDLEQWEYVNQKGKSIYKGYLKAVKTKQAAVEVIPIKLAGHTPLPEGLPKLEIDYFAVNGEIVERIPKIPIVQETTYKKIYHLRLNEPLDIGDRFDLKVHCSWPGIVVSQLSYVHMPHVHLHEGVKKEVTKLISDKPMSEIVVYKFDLCSGDFGEVPERTNELRSQSPMELTLTVPNQKLGEVYIIKFEQRDSGR